MAQLLTRELVSYVLAQAADAELADRVRQLSDSTVYGFCNEGLECLVDTLEARVTSTPSRDAVTAAMAELQTPAAHYVRARLAAQRGDLGQSIAEITRTIEALQRPEPAILALRARWFVRRAELERAAADLKLAFQTHPSYPFFVRTEKLVEKVLGQGGLKLRRSVKVALLASSTTALFAPVLRTVLFARGIKAEIYEGPFGNYRQEILDPSSGLYAFRPDLVLMLTNARDLDLPPSGGVDAALRFCADLRALWSRMLERNPCHIVQAGFDVAPGGAWGSLESNLMDGRVRALQQANIALSAELPASVSFLDVNTIASPQPWSDPREWHVSKQYPGAASLPAFAEAVSGQFAAVLGLGAKVLVLDLDNTLWGGVIGEDGIGGIVLGQPSAEGEAYQELQRYAKELKGRGVLLAVCSKNNPADAELPFREHESMLLKREDFVGFRANWEDKASNLRALAKELSLGLDSFVFLDDNPFERSWVRSSVPEVTVPEAGTSPWDMLEALKRGRYFDSVSLTQEDLERHLSYEVNVSLQSAGERGQETLEDFLTGLSMVSQNERVNAATLQRVTQLINKTNQFNVTMRRYTAEQVKQLSESADWWCRSFRLADRFGDHGLIGVILVHVRGSDWIVDTWLMSCRVLGRRMEEFMCGRVIAAAAEAGAKRVLGSYVRADKNGMVADLYKRMGFTQGEEQDTFVFDLAEGSAPTSPWIRGREP